MDVSKNRGTPKWMVYNGKPYSIKMDDLGVPLFLETPMLRCTNSSFSKQFWGYLGVGPSAQPAGFS